MYNRRSILAGLTGLSLAALVATDAMAEDTGRQRSTVMLTPHNIDREIAEHEGYAAVLVYSTQADTDGLQAYSDNARTVFTRLADEFTGVKFGVFDLQQLGYQGLSPDEIDSTMEGLGIDMSKGSPQILLYRSESFDQLADKQLTVKIGAPDLKSVDQYTGAMQWLFRKNYVENGPNYFILTDEDKVRTVPR